MELHIRIVIYAPPILLALVRGDLYMFVETVLEHLLASEIGHVLHRSVYRVRFFRCSIIKPSTHMRVAFSALLRIADSDQYLLVRNLHRPETFGPFGGVYKYFDDAQPALDNFDFHTQAIGPGSDMKNDLRGFLPRKNLSKLVSWYQKQTDRESFKQCVCRELKEELLEINLPRNIRCPEELHFRLVRVVAEGPESVPGQLYSQFRIFEIYDLFPRSTDISRFLRQLVKAARRNNNLLLANAQEIIVGRAKTGEVIGNHAGYLIGRKRIRPDTPAFGPQ